LQRGDFFGETALLTGARAQRDDCGDRESRGLCTGKSDFDAVIMASAPLEEELRKALFARQ